MTPGRTKARLAGAIVLALCLVLWTGGSLAGAQSGGVTPTPTLTATGTPTLGGSVSPTQSTTPATAAPTETPARTEAPAPYPAVSPSVTVLPSPTVPTPTTPTTGTVLPTPLPTFLPTLTPTRTPAPFPTRTPTATMTSGPILDATLQPGLPLAGLLGLGDESGLTLRTLIPRIVALIAVIGGLVFAGVYFAFSRRGGGMG